MRWEKLQIVREEEFDGNDHELVRRVVKRWGHTINIVLGGLFFYCFGGVDDTGRKETNKVLVFDTTAQKWREPVIRGVPPPPRIKHTANAVGDNIYVFGGATLRMSLFNDLHVLNTSTNTWTTPTVNGEVPRARKGHAAAVIGTQLYIYGGCGLVSDWMSAVLYDDLYILDTDTFVWSRAVTSGDIPSHRENHTLSSWGNKLVILGGKDFNMNFHAGIHILDTDTLVWTELNMHGQIMSPRASHTAVAVGKNLFVFGGYFGINGLYGDLHKIDLDTGVWTKLTGVGEGPSPRQALAGDFLYSRNAAALVFFGGCNCENRPTEDLYYFHTGQGTTDMREYRPFPGFRTFQATVKMTRPDLYEIETTIEGRVLRGFLFRSIDGPNSSPGESSQIRENAEPEQTTEHQNANP